MIILFSHQKGGVGKSTIAVNIAYQLAKKYKNIAMLDLDSQNSTILFNKIRENNNLDIIKTFKEASVNFTDIVNHYRSIKDNLLIVDSGGYDSDINRAILIKADMIITPVGISQIEIFGLQNFIKILEKASKATGKIIKTNVLLNNIDSRSKTKLLELQEYIKSKDGYLNLLNTVLFSRADYKNSYAEGLTVKEYNKKGVAQKEIKELRKEIYKCINN